MSAFDCPDESQLWRSLRQRDSGSSVGRHLADCAACRQRLQRLERECATLEQAMMSVETLSRISISGAEETAATAMSPTQRNRGRKTDDVPGPLLMHGDVIGKYKIEECLSSGGQGAVYRARDPQLHRDVAVKISHLRLEHDQPRTATVLWEGTVLAQIEHPHLAHIYDGGIHDQRPYLVMELVRGATLRQHVERRAMSDVEIRRIMAEISEGLLAAHRKGILHLDLKPDNVMIDMAGSCKLLDFGMAWMSSQTAESGSRYVIGTPEFMSPEQIAGDSDRWSRATDVYGLGSILYYLLTGDSPLSHPVSNIDSAIRELAGARQRLCNQRSRSRLAQICKRALDPEPSCRFENVEAFLAALHPAPAGPHRIGMKSSLGILLVLLLIFGRSAPFASGPQQLQPVDTPIASTPSVLRHARNMNLVMSPRIASRRLLIWSPRTGLNSITGIRIPEDPDLPSRLTIWVDRQEELVSLISIPQDCDTPDIRAKIASVLREIAPQAPQGDVSSWRLSSNDRRQEQIDDDPSVKETLERRFRELDVEFDVMLTHFRAPQDVAIRFGGEYPDGPAIAYRPR